MRPRLHRLFVAVATAAGLAACGGGSDSAPTPPSGAAPPAPAPAPTPAPTPGPAPTPEPAPAPVPAPAPAQGNHTVAQVEFAQSMLFASSDPELVLVANRAALVKVNVTAPTSPATKPIGVLRIEDSTGALLREVPLTAPSGSLPTSAPTRPSFADSYSATLPGDLVRSAVRIRPVFTPAATNAPTLTPRVGGGVALQVVAVPVQIGATVGQIVGDVEGYLGARLPAAQITRTNHAPMVSALVTQLPSTADEWSTAFSRILGEVDDLHLLENAGSHTHYFGFIPKRTSGIAGLGYRPGNAAVGFDVPNNAAAVRETMVHEIGHNLSLRHAPCGDPSGPDPNYPYANAAMGAGSRFIWGYDAAAARFIDPTPSTVHDVMSYCSGNWFSDYNYRLMQVFLTPADRTASASSDRAQAASAADAQDLLVVSGEVDAQGLHVNPVKSTLGTPRAPDAGPYLLRITTQAGAVIEQRFATREVDHDGSRERFGFTIAHPGAIDRLEVLRDGRLLHQRAARSRAQAAPPSSAPTPLVQASEHGGVLDLHWDASRHAYLTVTHVGAVRTVVGVDLQSGATTVPTATLPAGGHFEFGLSDGLNTQRVTQSR